MKVDRHLLYIASWAIEDSLRSQGELWVPRPEQTQAADLLHWPGLSLCGAYYDLCFSHRSAPSQKAYLDLYMGCHEDEVGVGQVRDAMKARAARAYNSLVAEHHLMSLCIESKMFDACYKAESLDLLGMVDLVVRVGPNQVGFAIQVPTREAAYWRKVKAERQARRAVKWEWPIEELFMNFDQMKELSGIHLFTEDWVEIIWGKASQYRFL